MAMDKEITSYLTHLFTSKVFLWIIDFCFSCLETYLFFAAFHYFPCYAFSAEDDELCTQNKIPVLGLLPPIAVKKDPACQESRACAKAPSISYVLPDSTSKAIPVGIAYGALLEEQKGKSLLHVCSMKGIYNYCFCLSHRG